MILTTLIISGGRDYVLRKKHIKRLERLVVKLSAERRIVTRVAHGNCPSGADQVAELWAASMQLPVDHYDANWKDLGRAAGPIRNEQMAAAHLNKDCVVVLLPGGRGTANMAEQALKYGLDVEDWRTDGE